MRLTECEYLAAYQQKLSTTCSELGVSYTLFREDCITAALDATKTMIVGVVNMIKEHDAITRGAFEQARKEHDAFKHDVMLFLAQKSLQAAT